jgi:excisionase family DNA binding protein
MDNIDNRQLYTLFEAANLLRISPSTIRRWWKEGKIKVIRIYGNKPRVTQDEMDRLLKEFVNYEEDNL